MKKEMREKILELARPIVESLGLEIWGLELGGNAHGRVCLFVDAPQGKEPELSATIEQCETISRQLGLALDVEDLLPGPWTLEISSPGLERRFFSLGQLGAYVGDVLEVSLKEPIAPGRSAWKGILLKVDGASFELKPCQVSGEGEILEENAPAVNIPWNLCKKVRRMHIFQLPKKPGKGSGRTKN